MKRNLLLPISFCILMSSAFDCKAIPNPYAFIADLKEAINGENEEKMTELLNRGGYPDVYNRGEETLLIYAIRRGSVPMVQALLRRGANVNLTPDSFDSPLIVAVKALKFVSREKSNEVASHKKIVHILLAAGASNNTQSLDSESTPETMAARWGFTDLAEAIRIAPGKRGIKRKNVPDMCGKTAQMYLKTPQ